MQTKIPRADQCMTDFAFISPPWDLFSPGSLKRYRKDMPTADVVLPHRAGWFMSTAQYFRSGQLGRQPLSGPLAPPAS
jgi:hypothetical protein